MLEDVRELREMSCLFSLFVFWEGRGPPVASSHFALAIVLDIAGGVTLPELVGYIIVLMLQCQYTTPQPYFFPPLPLGDLRLLRLTLSCAGILDAQVEDRGQHGAGPQAAAHLGGRCSKVKALSYARSSGSCFAVLLCLERMHFCCQRAI